MPDLSRRRGSGCLPRRQHRHDLNAGRDDRCWQWWKHGPRQAHGVNHTPENRNIVVTAQDFSLINQLGTTGQVRAVSADGSGLRASVCVGSAACPTSTERCAARKTTDRNNLRDQGSGRASTRQYLWALATWRTTRPDLHDPDYFTRMPGAAPASGERMNSPGTSPEASEAASTMPSERPNFILHGARLATITVRRPTSSAGS